MNAETTTMVMAMARSRSPTQMRPAISFWLSLFFFIIMEGTANKLARVEAGTPPSDLVLYVHQNLNPPNATTVISVSPSAASGGPPLGFGTIAVLSNILREGAAEDSPVLGTIFGEGVFEINLAVYLTGTYVITSPSYAGSISIQGVTTAAGDGEIGVTTGTGDFRWARGYAQLSGVSQTPGGVLEVIKVHFHLKYD